jgi:hypothetical protein
LIDFARSDFGPITIDLAKLMVDILVFCEKDKIQLGMFQWDGLMDTSLSKILNIFNKYLTAPDDKKFFNMALRAYANTYLTYPDVAKEVKTVIENILKYP